MTRSFQTPTRGSSPSGASFRYEPCYSESTGAACPLSGPGGRSSWPHVRSGRGSSASSSWSRVGLRGDALESKYVKRLGERVLQYKDDVVQLVVGYRYAANSLNQKWILLDTYMTPVWNRPLSFQREDSRS